MLGLKTRNSFRDNDIKFLFYIGLNSNCFLFRFVKTFNTPDSQRSSIIYHNMMSIHFQSNWDEGHLDPLPFHLLLTSDLFVSPAAGKQQRDKYISKLFFIIIARFYLV